MCTTEGQYLWLLATQYIKTHWPHEFLSSFRPDGATPRRESAYTRILCTNICCIYAYSTTYSQHIYIQYILDHIRRVRIIHAAIARVVWLCVHVCTPPDAPTRLCALVHDGRRQTTTTTTTAQDGAATFFSAPFLGFCTPLTRCALSWCVCVRVCILAMCARTRRWAERCGEGPKNQ